LVLFDKDWDGDLSIQIAAEATASKGHHCSFAFEEDVLRRHQQVRSEHAHRARSNFNFGLVFDLVVALDRRRLTHDVPRARHQLFRLVG
jgi:hypothetical protein